MPSASPTSPSPAAFEELARTHTLIPVSRTLSADLETPVSAFLRLAAPDKSSLAAEPEAFLLESVEGGERIGRYTFMGIQPYKKITSRGSSLTVIEGKRTRHFEGDIFAEFKQALAGHTPARLPGLPPFTSGAVGFFSYDVVRQIERLPSFALDELHTPDACLMFFDQVLAFDHVRKEIHLICTANLQLEPDPKAAYARSLKRLDKLERRLARALPKASAPNSKSRSKAAGKLELTPRTAKPSFLAAVAAIKDYIAAGDIFQCVLSQRFDCTPAVDPFAIYRALRIVNPSPYMYFLRFDPGADPGSDAAASSPTKGKRKKKAPSAPSSAHIVGASPELLVRVTSAADGTRKVEYRPIAGTRPRGVDEAEDRQHEADLRADAKEVAEHIMLVDLGRNDVGRVSEYGTVQVKELMFVERYSHVMHLVSALEGRLRQELSPLEALKSCFPAGTLSGAPKIRAMEIIEELEPARRGVYGGAILYADFSGNLDSCIAIRTLYMHNGQGHIQAGAGIVADSIAENEYTECANKAQAVVRAIERARG